MVKDLTMHNCYQSLVIDLLKYGVRKLSLQATYDLYSNIYHDLGPGYYDDNDTFVEYDQPSRRGISIYDDFNQQLDVWDTVSLIQSCAQAWQLFVSSDPVWLNFCKKRHARTLKGFINQNICDDKDNYQFMLLESGMYVSIHRTINLIINLPDLTLEWQVLDEYLNKRKNILNSSHKKQDKSKELEQIISNYKYDWSGWSGVANFKFQNQSNYSIIHNHIHAITNSTQIKTVNLINCRDRNSYNGDFERNDDLIINYLGHASTN